MLVGIDLHIGAVSAMFAVQPFRKDSCNTTASNGRKQYFDTHFDHAPSQYVSRFSCISMMSYSDHGVDYR